MSNVRLSSRVFAGFAALALMVGCGGSAAPSVSVAVSPTAVTMVAGATQTFTATVTNDGATPGVTWSASVGTITAAGVYTAPTPVPTTATITATSKTDTTKSATATVTFTPISVAIATTPVAMVAGATQTFAATVSNDITPSAGVTWTASVGSITVAGVYTAPTPVSTASATITATSKTDTTKSATATVTLTPIAVTIPTTPTAIAGAGTEAITATVTGDATLNAGVTWSITSGGGALSAVTTTSVTYTAPLPVTTANAVITATSKTDTTKTATITIPLTPISVGAISPLTVNLGNTSTQAFTGAAVSNDSSNSGVTWSISPATGAGSINSSTGAYTAPTGVISAVTTVTVTAASVKDPTKSATATITLQPITIAAVSPATISLDGGATQNFTGAALTYDGSNSGVTWSISPATGAGSINSSTGAYTAPAVVGGTSPVTVTVTAASVKDPTKTATAAITLNPIVVSFTTTTTGITLDSGQTLALAAALTNDASSLGATFAATGAGSVAPGSAAGNAPATTLTATGSAASTVTVTATSIADTTKTATTSSITVNPALAFTTAPGALTAGSTNTAYAGATIAVSGGTGTKTFAIASGALPTGLTLSAAGAISGTVTGTANTYTFAVKVTDAATTPATLTSGSYTIAVTATPLVWTTPSAPVTLPAATAGTAIAPYTLTASGGTGAITYSVNSGTLPAGLSIVGNQIVGTPTQPTLVAGTVVTIKATDSAMPVPATLISSNITIIVNPVTLVVNTPTLPVGTVSAAYNTTGYQFTSTGGTGAITWTMSPTNVDGLTLSTGGLLSGTPTATYGPATISVTATDSATSQQQTKTITPSLTVTNALTITTNQSTLPVAYSGVAYTSTTLVAAGGTSPYTWSVTSGLTGSNSLATLNLAVSSAGVITGTPTTAGTANFTVQVTDSASHTATASYSITAYVPLALPPGPTPSTLPAATTSAPYTGGTIVSTGGVAPYTWTVNGSNATTGSVSLGNGTMQASASGGTLNITGQPSTTGTISFIASVKDSTSTTAGPITYTIAVSTNYSIGGNIGLANYCGGSPTLPGFTVTLTQGATTIQTTTATNGSYSFPNVPNGTYTVTPTYSGPTGSGSVFYPASQSVTVNNANLSNTNYSVNLGYTVSGTVAYTGVQTKGQAYLVLTNTNCGGGTVGTSIAFPFTASGAYTVRGVPPGSYTLQAFMDPLGKGIANASDPAGSSSVTISTANFTGANVTLTDPATVTLGTSAPTLQGVAAFNTGAFASYKAITNSNGVEMATSYTLQWSTTSAFTAVAGSQTFPANGNNTNVWFVNGLTNGNAYYFRAYGTSAGTAQSTFSSVFGPVTIGPNTTGSTVSGSVTFTGTATGPMYVGLYNQNTGVLYAEYIASPAGPAQAYTVTVPNSASAVYQSVAVIDQNNDGIIDVGDLQNTNNNNGSSLISITGNTAGVNQTLPSAGSTASVTTQNYQSTSSGGSSQSFSLNFQVNSLVKLPVAVTLSTSTNSDGANAIAPTDIAVCAGGNNGCGQGFQYQVNTAGVSPTANDVYTFAVTYSDGTTGNITATVSAVLSALATNLSPSVTSSSLTPTFTWTDPANASNYTYSFQLSPQNGGNNIWQVPGNNSNSNGFSSSITSIPWITSGNDVTGASGNLPSVTALTNGATYNWQIQLQDSNGNQATQQTYFVAQ